VILIRSSWLQSLKSWSLRQTRGGSGKQYIAVYSGIGGWAGIGLAAGLTNPNDGLGAVGGYAGLKSYTALGGALTVFALPQT
jgi:glucose dehydrogenase